MTLQSIHTVFVWMWHWWRSHYWTSYRSHWFNTSIFINSSKFNIRVFVINGQLSSEFVFKLMDLLWICNWFRVLYLYFLFLLITIGMFPDFGVLDCLGQRRHARLRSLVVGYNWSFSHVHWLRAYSTSVQPTICSCSMWSLRVLWDTTVEEVFLFLFIVKTNILSIWRKTTIFKSFHHTSRETKDMTITLCGEQIKGCFITELVHILNLRRHWWFSCFY